MKFQSFPQGENAYLLIQQVCVQSYIPMESPGSCLIRDTGRGLSCFSILYRSFLVGIFRSPLLFPLHDSNSKEHPADGEHHTNRDIAIQPQRPSGTHGYKRVHDSSGTHVEGVFAGDLGYLTKQVAGKMVSLPGSLSSNDA